MVPRASAGHGWYLIIGFIAQLSPAQIALEIPPPETRP